mgnify:CR=1 FL=1
MTNQKIRFSPRTKPEFIKELRGKISEYFEQNKISKYGNTHIIIKSSIMMLFYLAPYLLMITGVITSLPLILAGWIFMGIGMAGLGMVLMHDANHGTWSESRKVNNLLGKSLYLFGGFPVTWKHQHNTLHHGFTNIDGEDEDINPGGILRFSPHQPLKKIHRFQHWYAWFFYGLMTIAWITTKDFRQMFNYKKEGVALQSKKSYNRLIFDLTVSKILYYAVFLVIPMIVLPIAWYWTLLFFFVMHFISGLTLSTIFQTAHVMPDSEYPLPDEEGRIDNNWAIHQLSTTTNYSPNSRLFSWLIGGLNYQVEHHLFPNISHVHYRSIANIVRSTAAKHDLPYHQQGSFLNAVMQHTRMLKKLGRLQAEPVRANFENVYTRQMAGR